MAFNEKNTNSERKSARKAYSQECKLNVVSWFYNNRKKVNLTARNFKIDKKNETHVSESPKRRSGIRSPEAKQAVVVASLFSLL